MSAFLEEEQLAMPALRASQSPPPPAPQGVPTGASKIVTSIQRALAQAPTVLGVEVVSGSVTELQVALVNEDPESVLSALKVAKMATLNAAALSLNTYVVGYLRDPFKDVGGKGGFSVRCGVVPPRDESNTCWSLYETGCCQKGRSCRKKHPGPAKLEQIRVMIK